MKFGKLVTSIGLTVGSVLFVANSAQAFTTNFTQRDAYGNIVFDSTSSENKENFNAKNDIFLESITQNDKTFNNFSYVGEVKIKNNDLYTGGNTGAASTDKGINASAPETSSEDPTEVQLAKYLGNNNLNNIVDTEDKGTFMMDIFFDTRIRKDNSLLDSLFFYERGENSNMLIQAIDKDGNLIGKRLLLEGGNKAPNKNKITDSYDDFIKQNGAGFSISTDEIKGSTQKVGSWGVSLADLGVTSLSGVQIQANGKNYNGPDFKVVARKVPEPGTIIGLGSVAALAFFRRRKSASRIAS